MIVTASQLQPVECAALTQPKLIAHTFNAGGPQQGEEDVSGYLASYYAQTLGHGRPDCPWTISVRPGQRIQLTLIDFSSDARYTVDDGGSHESGPPGPPASAASAVDPAVPDFCYRYAQVSEGMSTSRRYTVCAEDSREQIVYTSSTNVLNVEITDTVLADAALNFLIKYTGNCCCTHVTSVLLKIKVKRLKVCIARSQRNPVAQQRDVTCRMGSHGVTCHATRVNAPRLNPSQ